MIFPRTFDRGLGVLPKVCGSFAHAYALNMWFYHLMGGWVYHFSWWALWEHVWVFGQWLWATSYAYSRTRIKKPPDRRRCMGIAILMALMGLTLAKALSWHAHESLTQLMLDFDHHYQPSRPQMKHKEPAKH